MFILIDLCFNLAGIFKEFNGDKMKKTIIFMIFFISFSFYIYPEVLKNFSDVFDFTSDYSNILPKEQITEGIILLDKKNVNYIHSIIVNEKTQVIEMKTVFNKETVIDVFFNKSLELKNINWLYDKTIKFNKNDFNKMTTEFNDNRKLLIKKLFYNEKLVSEYKINSNKNTLTFDSCFTILQACLLKDIKGFKADILFGSQTDKYSCEFNLVQTKNLLELSPVYENVPAFFKNKSVSNTDMNVYVFNLTGIAGAVYKHKYYFAFDNTPVHKFIAYWGGDPINAEYRIVN